jgi:hypothetical protein
MPSWDAIGGCLGKPFRNFIHWLAMPEDHDGSFCHFCSNKSQVISRRIEALGTVEMIGCSRMLLEHPESFHSLYISSGAIGFRSTFLASLELSILSTGFELQFKQTQVSLEDIKGILKTFCNGNKVSPGYTCWDQCLIVE